MVGQRLAALRLVRRDVEPYRERRREARLRAYPVMERVAIKAFTDAGLGDLVGTAAFRRAFDRSVRVLALPEPPAEDDGCPET